jgi:hypothetical protein
MPYTEIPQPIIDNHLSEAMAKLQLLVGGCRISTEKIQDILLRLAESDLGLGFSPDSGAVVCPRFRCNTQGEDQVEIIEIYPPSTKQLLFPKINVLIPNYFPI